MAFAKPLDGMAARLAAPVRSSTPSLWQAPLAWLRRRSAESAAIRTLEELSDRQLDDMGLSRSEIRRAVRGRR